MSKSASEAYSSSGRHGGAFSSSPLVALVSSAYATIRESGRRRGTWPLVCSTSRRFPLIVALPAGCVPPLLPLTRGYTPMMPVRASPKLLGRRPGAWSPLP